MVSVGSVTVDLVPDARQFDSLTSAKLNPIAMKAGDEFGRRFAESMQARLTAANPDVKVGVDTTRAGLEVDRFLVDTKAKADAASEKSGESSGGLLAQGVHDGFVRKSPLIAAAVAGGLLAGAPAILAGAGVLFGGIAAAAVHSNADVQSAFAGTKTSITSTFTSAASVTVPMFVGALGRIGSAVQALGPQLHEAFAALGGPIDSLTTGLIALANNAMPGIVAAVKSAGPVFQGLSSLLGSIGTGIGQMFQILSEHSNAAGTVLSSLGSILGSLLPILGQLVGAGAELGAQILPPIAAALHVVADALNAVAPILPVVLAGFLGFKAVSALTGPLGTLSAKLQTVAADSEGLGSKIAGTAASGVSKLGTALPVLGTAVAVLGAAFEADQQQVSRWAQALLDGGRAAATANAQMQAQTSFINDQTTGWKGLANNLIGTSNTYRLVGTEQDRAKKSAQDLYSAMSPLEKAQQDVTTSQNDYLDAVSRWGASSGQAVGASVTYRDAQQHLASVQDELAKATHGVTQAILDEADQALAAADSGLAYRLAQNQATTAAKDFATAVKGHKAALNDNSDASLTYEQALLRQAEAAGKAAADASGLTDKMQLQQASDKATLSELYKLRDEYGANFPASLQATITKLEKSGVALDDVGAKKPTPTVDANTAPLNSKILAANGELANVGAQHPTPTAGLNIQPLMSMSQQGLNNLAILNGLKPTPTAFLNDLATGPARAIQAVVNSLTGKTITITTQHNDIYSNYTAPGSGSSKPVATGGQIGAVIRGKRFDIGGRISGPGGPTDDLIPAVTYAGVPLRLSNSEWIIKGSSSDKYGPSKMAAINAGTATVLLPSQSPGLAAGGIYNGAGEPELRGARSFEHAMSGASGGGGPASFTGDLYLDSGEFLGKVRGIAQQETANGMAIVRNRMTSNP